MNSPKKLSEESSSHPILCLVVVVEKGTKEGDGADLPGGFVDRCEEALEQRKSFQTEERNLSQSSSLRVICVVRRAPRRRAALQVDLEHAPQPELRFELEKSLRYLLELLIRRAWKENEPTYNLCSVETKGDLMT